MPSDGPAAPDAAAVVAERSRLRWALLHPRGGRPPIPFENLYGDEVAAGEGQGRRGVRDSRASAGPETL